MYTPPIWPDDLVWYCAAYSGTSVNSAVQSILTSTSTTIDPTGATDSTAGIQAVVSACAGSHALNCPPLYFPPGTYKVTNQIQWINGGTVGYGCGIFGAGRGVTIFSIPASTSAFSNASSPLGLFKTNSQSGSGSQAFGNFFSDFTINVGASNPGAIGIDDLSNNSGGGQRVAITSLDTNGAGYAGLLLSRTYSGPCLWDDVQITGFVTPIDMGDAGTSGNSALYGSTQYSVTFKDITLTQMADTVQLFRPSTNVANIDGLTAVNAAGGALTVPVVKMNSAVGGLYLINWTPGNGSGVPAIDNTISGRVYLRNPEGNPTGWTAMVKNGSTLVPFQTAEWFTGANIPNAWGQTNAGLNLTVPTYPVYNDSSDPPSGWANAITEGAAFYTGGTYVDSAPAINTALASGAATTYLPSYQAGGLASNALYEIGSTIVVPSTAQRLIIGGQVGFAPQFSSGPLFTFQSRSTPFFIEAPFGGMFIQNGSGSVCYPPIVYNQTGGPLVINWFLGQANISSGAFTNYVLQVTDGATLFVKNATGYPNLYVGPNSSAYVWQFDNELAAYPWLYGISSPYPTGRLWNSGGTARIFGMKSEDTGMCSLTDGGGQTEIIGFWNLQYGNGGSSSPQPQSPFFVNNGSAHSVSGITVLQSSGSTLPGTVFYDTGPATANNPAGIGVAVNVSGNSITGPYALGGPFPQASVGIYPSYSGGPVINMYSTRLIPGESTSGVGGLQPAVYFDWHKSHLLINEAG